MGNKFSKKRKDYHKLKKEKFHDHVETEANTYAQGPSSGMDFQLQFTTYEK